MVIFTETMAKLVSELSDKPLKVTVSEETVVFEFTTSDHKKPLRIRKDKTSQSYRKNAKLFTFNGETLSIREWAEKYSVPYRTMVTRLRRGSPETKYRRGKEPKRVKKG